MARLEILDPTVEARKQPLTYVARPDSLRGKRIGLVENTKSSYYESLRASSESWHQGQHSLIPWWEYFLGITRAAYEQLDQKLGGGELPSKADRVRVAVQVMPAVFSKAELGSLCPEISERTVKRILEELRGEGQIEVAKRGRNAVWRKM